ncbi:MAG: CNNM domain-containing protein [Planctomycetota bacterium]
MPEYLLMLLGLLVSAFHSGAETGFYCVNRLRLRLRSEQNRRAAGALQALVNRPQLAICTLLVGTNVGNYVTTVLFTDELRQAGYAVRADLYSSLILPPILLVFSEILPKSLFQHHAERLMYRAVWPLRVSEVLFYPFSALLRGVSRIPQLLVSEPSRPRKSALTRDNFQFYLSEGAAKGTLTSFQRTMAENIMRLRGVRVDSTMTPLPEVVMIEEGADYAELSELLREHRYSRLPVYREERDDIVGMINVLDVASVADAEPSVRELVREVLTVTRDASVADALATLRDRKQQFAGVNNEEGRAVGIVTAKDLVEEIVGELEAW